MDGSDRGALEDPLERRVVVAVQTSRPGGLGLDPAAWRGQPVGRRAGHHPEAAVAPELALGPEAVRRDDDGDRQRRAHRPHAGQCPEDPRDPVPGGLLEQAGPPPGPSAPSSRRARSRAVPRWVASKPGPSARYSSVGCMGSSGARRFGTSPVATCQTLQPGDELPDVSASQDDVDDGTEVTLPHRGPGRIRGSPCDESSCGSVQWPSGRPDPLLGPAPG